DVDVGREAIGVVERADTHERKQRACARIVAPQCDAAMRAARDVLSLAAVGRRHYLFRRAVRQLHGFGFDQRVQHERAAGFALAPAAMTAVHEQRRANEPVADDAAIAAAFEGSSESHEPDMLYEWIRRFLSSFRGACGFIASEP